MALRDEWASGEIPVVGENPHAAKVTPRQHQSQWQRQKQQRVGVRLTPEQRAAAIARSTAMQKQLFLSRTVSEPGDVQATLSETWRVRVAIPPLTANDNDDTALGLGTMPTSGPNMRAIASI